MSNKEWKQYLLNDIPADLHERMKKAAKARKTSMRLVILGAVEDKLKEWEDDAKN